jgi:hypothetical protein
MEMYPDESLLTCPVCGQLGIHANDLWNKSQFFHKVPSEREGYYTFTQSHLTVGVSA